MTGWLVLYSDQRSAQRLESSTVSKEDVSEDAAGSEHNIRQDHVARRAPAGSIVPPMYGKLCTYKTGHCTRQTTIKHT